VHAYPYLKENIYSDVSKGICTFANVQMPLVLFRCWLGGSKGVAGMVICGERGADLHMAQLMPLPLTVSCFSKIQIGFTFLVPGHPVSPRKKAVKRVCVSLCTFLENFAII